MTPFLSLSRRACAALFIAPFLVATPALSEAPILTLTGHGPPVTLSRAELMALGPIDITTTSIWTEGAHRFTGIPLRKIAARFGLAPEATLLLRALNDYAVTLPLAETTDDWPILAYEMDGAPMPVRDKGPLWVIYPYDQGSDFQTVTVYARSIWQLDRIEIQN
jgi:hypothetical protein